MSVLYVFVSFEQTTGYKSGYRKSLYHSTCLSLEIVTQYLSETANFSRNTVSVKTKGHT